MSLWMFGATGVLFFSGFLMMLADRDRGEGYEGGKIMCGLSERMLVWAFLVRILEQLP